MINLYQSVDSSCCGKTNQGVRNLEDAEFRAAWDSAKEEAVDQVENTFMRWRRVERTSVEPRHVHRAAG